MIPLPRFAPRPQFGIALSVAALLPRPALAEAATTTGFFAELGHLPERLADARRAFIDSFPDAEATRQWLVLVSPALWGWLLVMLALFLPWLVLRARRARTAIETRTAPDRAHRAKAFAQYVIAAYGPLAGGGAVLVIWATAARPDPPALRALVLLALPFLGGMAAMATVSTAFTALSAFGRRAKRAITHRLPPQLGAISALLIAAMLMREGAAALAAVPRDTLALFLETIAALVAVRAMHEQRFTLRQLLRAESATPDQDPPTLPERITSAIADRWHLLGIALVIVGLLGRYGLFGPDRRFGLFPDLLLSLAILLATGLGVFLTERLHGSLLSRMGVTTDTTLRDRFALRLGRVLRTGMQIALAVWAAAAISAVWDLTFWRTDRNSAASTGITALLTTLIALFALWFIWTLVDALLDWSVSQTRGRSTRIRTLLPFLRNFALVVVATLAVISVLSNLGVDVAPLLAGAGVVGIAIGIGAQKLVGDVITGIFIIFEDSIAIGETVEAAAKTGVVEGMTVRTLKLRDGDGALHSIPYSSITTLKNTSRGYGAYTISVTVLHPEDTNRALAEVSRIGREISNDPDWKTSITGDFSLWGVDQVSPAGVVIKGNIRSHPNAQWALGREINRRIVQRFAELGIAQVIQAAPWAEMRTGARSDAAPA